MYEDDDDDFDFSDYSDYEYNTSVPYNYELNSYTNRIEETPIEKLYRLFRDDANDEIKEFLPELIKYKNSNKIQNGTPKSVDEKGDSGSDGESDDFLANENDDRVMESTIEELIFPNGDTPLITAAARANYEILKFLIEKGFDVNYKLENTNKTALMTLCMSKPPSWGYISEDWNKKALPCLRLLISNKADPNVRGYINTDDHGNTALHYAALNNHWKFIEALIHLNIDIDCMNNHHKTALMLASKRGYVACCNVLIMNGASPQMTDKSDNNAGDIAEQEGFNHLADALHLLSGSAKHNFRLYKLWSEFHKELEENGEMDQRNSETNNPSNCRTSFNDSCLESFCAFLDASYLAPTLKEQGITIADLKSMDEEKLTALNIPSDVCEKIIQASKDLKKSSQKNLSKKISLEYGKPIKSHVMLDMTGSIVDHMMNMESKLEGLSEHVEKARLEYRDQYQIVNKRTIGTIQENCKKAEEYSKLIQKEHKELDRIISHEFNVSSESSSQSQLSKSNNSYFNWFNVSLLSGVVLAVGVVTAVSFIKFRL